ncbi:ubiquitin domain-containing 1 [Brachionus plicatilis]|uniref:Ubiquitin domain-containing 1 n=1 Tax=Brachionus plicatilis TaxID=10195 RepID=A0A3M7PG67_BRAPC|nr:ubiquitin domain-containing 1 [Brachionus plicatilis]
MGCVGSSAQCNPLGRRNRHRNSDHCEPPNNQSESRRSRTEPNRASSFSNLTSNSVQSNMSNSQYSGHVVPTGKNKRLKKDYARYLKIEKKMSEAQLRAKRDEFWDTAPVFEGKSEIWAALKAAVEALESKNFQLAQAIIDSASIIVPNGLLSDCYDELGNRYQIPAYVLAKPSTLTDKNEPSSESSSPNLKKKKKKKHVDDGEKKSQATISNDQIQIKLRVSSLAQDTNSDLKFMAGLNDTVLSLKQKLHDTKSIDAKNQRFYFGGRLMRDKDKLKSYKIKKNVVIQVIVREQDQREI